MRFTVAAASAVLAFATSVFAQAADFDPVTKPAPQEVVPAGKTYTIEWTAPAKYAADTDLITISLIGGDSQGTQVPLGDLASGIKNNAGRYDWAVDASLGAENVYGLVVKLESNPDAIFQYSNPFVIKKTGDDGSDDGSDAGDDGVVTITTKVGVKTVTISSCSTSTTTTSSSSSSTPVVTSTPKPTTYTPTYSQNSTTIAPTIAPTTIITSTAIVVPPTTTAPATLPPTDVPGAASRAGAGSLALVGALAVAILAL